MPKTTPILGYPSIAAACRALSAEGLTPVEIGERVGRSPLYVNTVLNSAWHSIGHRKLTLPFKLSKALAKEGQARGLDVAELAVALLDTIAENDLFEALLGEAGGGHA